MTQGELTEDEWQALNDLLEALNRARRLIEERYYIVHVAKRKTQGTDRPT